MVDDGLFFGGILILRSEKFAVFCRGEELFVTLSADVRLSGGVKGVEGEEFLFINPSELSLLFFV